MGSFRRNAALAAICAVLAATTGPPARAEGEADSSSAGRLVNLDTGFIPARGAMTATVDGRFFGGSDDNSYGNVSLNFGSTDRMGIRLRGMFSTVERFTMPAGVIRHGGSDVEVAAFFACPTHPRYAFMVGANMANTPAQYDPNVSVQFIYNRPLGGGTTFFFVPKALFLKGDPVLGLGAGISTRVTDQLQLVADFTGVVSGDNALDLTTGAKRRTHLWGAALRFTPRGEHRSFGVDVGVTNAYGITTNASFSPGLGGSTAIFAALHWSR